MIKLRLMLLWGPHPSQNPHMGLGKYGYGLDLNGLLLMKFMHESFELSAPSYQIARL